MSGVWYGISEAEFLTKPGTYRVRHPHPGRLGAPKWGPKTLDAHCLEGGKKQKMPAPKQRNAWLKQ